jgi:RNA polymerase sigma-70 factor (ECF subfamily)
MKQQPDEFLPTRESLLGRLKDWKDEESWREFVNIYRQLIFSAARKSGLTEAEADDVVQETIVSVAKTIREFQYDPERCSFKTWLRHLTQKRIADHYRKRPREHLLREASGGAATGTGAFERVPSPGDLETIWEEEWQKKILDAALERVRTQASARQYQMFDLYVLKKMRVQEVATALGTSVAQVYLAKHRISRLIKREVHQLKAKMGDE